MTEMPSCYGNEERKARKAHKCCECHGTIQPGEKYHFHHGVWDGEAHDYKVCVDCEALRAECDLDREPEECTPFERLSEAVSAMRSHAPELYERYVKIGRRRGAKWAAAGKGGA